MPTPEQGRFRERFAEVGAGLKKVEPERVPLPSIAGLKLDTSFDLSKLDSFSPAQVEIKAIAERVKPEGAEGLKIEADLGKLDQGVRKILQQQATDKIRRLVEEAQALIASGRFRPALRLLEEALQSEPGSGQILLLKGYCFFGMREYESALEVLDQSRGATRDPETVVLILLLQAACLRAVTQALEATILELIQEGRLQEALALVEGELRRQPSNIAFLYHQCHLLWLTGRAREAKGAVLESMRRVGSANAGLFQELLTQINVAENQQYLEAARIALRRGNPNQALQRLDACRAVLAGSEQYEAVRAYAEETRPRGAIGSWLAQARLAPPDDPVRQRVLLWLFSEELNAGVAALNAKEFDRAAATFAAASRIDSRCGIICYLHGLAIFEGYQQTFQNEQSRPDLDRAVAALTTASMELLGCSMDRTVSQQGEGLRRLVENHLAQLREAEAVNQLIQRFNDLMEGLEEHPVRSSEDLQRAERSFRELRQATALAQQSSTTDTSKTILGQLMGAIDTNLMQIDHLKEEARATDAVSNCVKSFNQMMEHYQQKPVRSRAELESALRRTEEISNMVRAARRQATRGSEGWQVLDKLEKAVQNVLRQLGS